METTIINFSLLVWTILVVVGFVLLFASVYSILKENKTDSITKIKLLIGVLLLPIVGPVLYFVNFRNGKLT